MGQGVTIRALSRCLKDRDDIIVVTNSLYVAEELSDSNVTLFLLGGLLEHDNHGIIGSLAAETMTHFYCDKMFFSCAGFNKQYGVMDYGGIDPTVQKDALARSQKRILVADSRKFRVNSALCICPVDDLAAVVTDSRLPEDYVRYFEEHNVELIQADV